MALYGTAFAVFYAVFGLLGLANAFGIAGG
jgi:hypothetical protein